MKRYLIILFVFFVTSSVLGQETSTEKKIKSWTGGAECCDNWIDKGKLITTYKDENVDYIAILEFDDDYIVFIIGIQNLSKQRILIDPSKFSIRMSAPVNKTFYALDAEAVAKKFQKRGSFRLALAGIFAGMATSQSTATITDNRGNRSNVVVTEPNRQAIENVRQKRIEQEEKNQNKAAVVRAVALPMQTLFPGEEVRGIVFFERKKVSNGSIVQFAIGDTTYEIPYGEERTKPGTK